jgi:hypothetical protein
LNAQDNLFQNETNSPVNTPVSQTPTAVPVTNFDFGAGFFDSLIDPERVRLFILQLNGFTLAWCILYSALFLWDFYFYRLKYTDGEIAREKIGIQSLNRAFKIWYSYLFCCLALYIYSLFPVVSLLTILVYFYKLLSVDLPEILDIIHDYVGLNGIHKNYRKIVTPIRRLLSWSK